MPTSYFVDTSSTLWFNTTVLNTTSTMTNLSYTPAWLGSGTSGGQFTNLQLSNPWNYTVPTALPETEAQKAARLRRVAQYERDRLKVSKQHRLAEARAERLLRSHLDVGQRKELATKNRFRVVLPDGTEYLVEKGFAGNLYRLEGGKKVEKLCVHPAMSVPDHDVMLAQLLMLRMAPQELLKLANKTPMHGVELAA